MIKNRWNNDLPTWIGESFYTKDEIDAKFGGVDGYSTVTVIVTYMNGSTETIDLLRRV